MFHVLINQTVDTLPSGHTPGVFEGVNHRIAARFRLFQSSASSHPERNSEPCWFPPISAADIFILCSCHIFDTAAGHQLCSSGKSDLVSPSGPCWCGPPCSPGWQPWIRCRRTNGCPRLDKKPGSRQRVDLQPRTGDAAENKPGGRKIARRRGSAEDRAAGTIEDPQEPIGMVSNCSNDQMVQLPQEVDSGVFSELKLHKRV